MAGKAVKALDRALEALAGQEGEGRLNLRLEAAIDENTDAALRAVAVELAGSKDARMFRSKAARLLLRRGAAAFLAERSDEA